MTPETCRNGHPRTPETAYVQSDGKRVCRVCRRKRQYVESLTPEQLEAKRARGRIENLTPEQLEAKRARGRASAAKASREGRMWEQQPENWLAVAMRKSRSRIREHREQYARESPAAPQGDAALASLLLVTVTREDR